MPRIAWSVKQRFYGVFYTTPKLLYLYPVTNTLLILLKRFPSICSTFVSPRIQILKVFDEIYIMNVSNFY